MSSKWELYDRLKNMSKAVGRITDEEMSDILEKLTIGIYREECIDKLVNSNIWLITWFSDKYLVESFPHRDDVLCEGLHTLCKAANKYIPIEGSKFVDYASNRISGSMYHTLTKNRIFNPSTETIEFISAQTEIPGAFICIQDNIQDPNQIDIDTKIDREKFLKMFYTEFDRIFEVKKDLLAKIIIKYNYQLDNADRTTVRNLAGAFGISYNGINKRKLKGLEWIKQSKEMQRLFSEFLVA